jgi:dihydropteroate synthase
MTKGAKSATRRDRFFETISKARVRRSVALMGVCNVTPDSFSDGGRHFTEDDAKARVDALIAEGADIVDIGGESTRPGARPVSADEQLSRVLTIVRYAAERTCVSIDTTDPRVAHACLDAGAVCVNDVSNLADPELADVAFGAGAALVLSHARGTQTSMRGFGGVAESAYDDVVLDVLDDFRAARNKAIARGVPHDAIVMDPGLGFGKTARHSMDLLRRTRELVLGAESPVLVGASRKSFLTLVDRGVTPSERIGASVMAAAFAARAGASVVRIHDVRATRQAIDLDTVLDTPPGHGDGRGVRDVRSRGDHLRAAIDGGDRAKNKRNGEGEGR